MTYHVLLLDCNLEAKSGATFQRAIAHWAPSFVTLHTSRVSDGDPVGWQRDIERYSGLIISGSASGIQSGEPWVEILAKALRKVTATGMPALGICFGHQLLAHAWGGTIEEDRLGYKIRGICEVEAAAQGWASPLVFADGAGSLQVLSSHRDQVVSAPPQWQILARSAACPIQAMCASDLPIVTVQWHPEADAAFIVDNPHPDWDHLVQDVQPVQADKVDSQSAHAHKASGEQSHGFGDAPGDAPGDASGHEAGHEAGHAPGVVSGVDLVGLDGNGILPRFFASIVGGEYNAWGARLEPTRDMMPDKGTTL